MITSEQFAEWKADPTTKAIFAELETARNKLKEKVSGGNTISQSAEATQFLTVRTIGQIEGLEFLLKVSYVDDPREINVNEISGY